jgi:hypothetical protein
MTIGGHGRRGAPSGDDPFGVNPFGGHPFGVVPLISTSSPSQHAARAQQRTSHVLGSVAFVFAPVEALLGHLGLARIRRSGERGRERA